MHHIPTTHLLRLSVNAGTGWRSVHVAFCTLLVTHVGFACEWELPCSLARPAFGMSDGWGARRSSPASWGCWLEGLPPPRLGVVIEDFLEDCVHTFKYCIGGTLQTWGGAERMSLGGWGGSPLPLHFRVCFWVAVDPPRGASLSSVIPSGSCPGFTDWAGTCPSRDRWGPSAGWGPG